MNIDKIEVSENNISMVLFPKKEMVFIEGNLYKINIEKIEELLRIIRTWEPEYYDDSYLDGNMYEINIYCGDQVDKLKGLRGHPRNYDAFSKLIRGIYDRREV